MKKKPGLKHLDCNGETIRIGDVVRIIGVSDDVCDVSPEDLAECLSVTLPAFQYLVGKYKRIKSFDQYGFAELKFRIREADGIARHFVWLEPKLLRLRKSRPR